jgi:hypothetical protein
MDMGPQVTPAATPSEVDKEDIPRLSQQGSGPPTNEAKAREPFDKDKVDERKEVDRSGNEVLDPSGESTGQGEGTASTGEGAEPSKLDEGHELGGLSERDRIIAVALGRGFSHEKAGEFAGVTSKTVQRRMADPTFVAAVSEERRRAFEEISGQLTHWAIQAVKTLVGVMRSDNPSDQRRAAEAILNIGGRYHRQLQDHELAARLEKLEACLATAEQPDAYRPADGDRS